MIPTRQRKANSSKTAGAATVRLIAYTRVSTTEQAGEGVSLAAQRERLEAYAKAHGFELVELVEEAGVSGKTAPGSRPGLGGALDRIRRGEADGLVAIKLDRISRSVRDVLALADDAQRVGWRLVTVNEALDTGSATGRFTLTILAALAQLEREQVGERTRAALDQVAREGRLRSRHAPFGYRAEAQADAKPRLVEAPGEQVILRNILDLDADGFGARRIANTLNQAGTPNPRTLGGWTHGTVAAILRTVDRRAKALGEGEPVTVAA